MNTPIQGNVDHRFEKVKHALAQNFADGLEHGAAVAVMVDGKLVVDLWAGHADQAKTKPWQRNSIANVWSSTKGVVALAVAMLVERGRLHYDEPIAKLWPEFAAGGKDHITLNHTMSHTSGLNGVNTPITEDDLLAWSPYVRALASMTPNWKPGTDCAYHALSYGHLACEPLQRVTGKSIGQFVQEEIAGPLGTDFFIGVPQDQDHRCVEMIAGAGCNDWVNLVLSSPFPQACANPIPVATATNDRRWRAAQVPGGNGHSDARALATIYGDIAGHNSKLWKVDTRTEATRVRYRGLDASFNAPTIFGAGFSLEDDLFKNPQSFGHNGWGGTMAFGDPIARIGFAYVTNHMLGFETIDPRRQRLVAAVYDAL